MTYRSFGPEMLNAGRTRRQMIPAQQQKREFMSDVSNRGAAVSDLTHELEAIANELGRLKATQPQTTRQPSTPNQPAFDANQLSVLVQSLKSDMRTQMRDDLDAQYLRLRDELDGLNAAIAGTALHSSFKGEISELLSGLETLAKGNRSIQSSQDQLSSYLQRELGELQTSLNGLARNDSLAKLDNRWDNLENRWDQLENRLESGAKSVDALAQSRPNGAAGAADFSQIDKRFDELSRAVAAIGTERQTPTIDTQAFDQIEKTMSHLSRKLELVGSFSGQNPSFDAIEARLSQLNDRFAELPDYFNQEPVMERIDRLAERVSALPSPSLSPASIDALTQQLNTLAGEIRGNTGGKPISDGMFDRLDNRLGSIEERIENLSLSEPATADTDVVIAALEQRFAELSSHLEAMQPLPNPAAAAQADFGALERKLGDIARQLTQTAAPNIGLESFGRLENQIADLSSMLAEQPRDNGNAFTARFEALEKTLSKNQHTVLDFARKAAEGAAFRSEGESNAVDSAHIVGVIAGELAALEQLTRNSNERSTSAFEGIHGALTKIADRLGALETKPAAFTASVPTYQQVQPAPSAPPMPTAAFPFADDGFDAPSLDVAEGDLGGIDVQDEPGVRKVRSPSEMAQEAATAAVSQAQPGDELEDVPLSPSASVPDLNSILKRVRDQKKAAQSQVAKEVDRKDHFLSIKRAAQAAANEVQQVKPDTNSNGALGQLKTIYTKFRRPILMAAATAVVAIGALQLTSALISSDAEQVSDAATQIQEPVQQQAQLSTAPVNAPELQNAQSAMEATGLQPPELQGANNNASLDDVANIAPQKAETPVEGSPRIVGSENSEPIVTETAKASPELNQPAAKQPDSTNSSPALAAAGSEPTIPNGFGPQPLIDAVKTNDVKAQFELGRRVAENQGDAAAQANAFAWFNAAAAQGFAPAQYRVGNMYEKGLGVERSASDAKLWYQMAAEAGNASAMHNLAVLFASGVDGTSDSESAVRWFQKAADLGVGDSQFNLGVMKGKGQGVAQDLEESYKWLAILAKSGDTEAAAKRDEVAKIMRPEQLQAAKAKVELWKPQTMVAEANDLAIPDGWKIAGGTTASVDVKKAVKNVQLILGKLGYNVGTPDGVMGENTRKAIRAFQKKEKLAVSGEIDGPLVKALLAKNG
jgi:localization factor PodJL